MYSPHSGCAVQQITFHSEAFKTDVEKKVLVAKCDAEMIWSQTQTLTRFDLSFICQTAPRTRVKRYIYSPLHLLDSGAKRTKDALANEARILNYQVNKLDFTSLWHKFETVMAPKDVRNGVLNSVKISRGQRVGSSLIRFTASTDKPSQ